MQGCRFTSKRGYKELDAILFGPRMATISLGVLG